MELTFFRELILGDSCHSSSRPEASTTQSEALSSLHSLLKWLLERCKGNGNIIFDIIWLSCCRNQLNLLDLFLQSARPLGLTVKLKNQTHLQPSSRQKWYLERFVILSAFTNTQFYLKKRNPRAGHCHHFTSLFFCVCVDFTNQISGFFLFFVCLVVQRKYWKSFRGFIRVSCYYITESSHLSRCVWAAVFIRASPPPCASRDSLAWCSHCCQCKFLSTALTLFQMTHPLLGVKYVELLVTMIFFLSFFILEWLIQLCNLVLSSSSYGPK